MAKTKNCPRCAETVKAEAQACRFCGFQFPAPPPRVRRSGKKCTLCGSFSSYGAKACEHCHAAFPPPSPKSALAGCLVIVAGVGLVVAAISSLATKHSSTTNPPAASSAENQQDKKDKETRDELTKMAYVAGGSLKHAMRNPDSLGIEDAYGKTVQFKGQGVPIVCIQYHAQNGFGGINREHVVFSAAGGDKSVRNWNRFCAGEGFTQLEYAVKSGAAMVNN